MKLHIGIAGPIATEHILDLLSCDTSNLPKGYTGAPLTAVLIKELLKQGHKISAFTTDNSIYLKSDTIKASGPNFDLYICPERPRAWRFNKFRLGRAIDGFAYERNQLVKAINIAKPQIINAHWSYEFALATITSGIPHLITCHDSPSVVFRYTRTLFRAIRYLMALQVFKKGQYFSSVSPYMAKMLQSYTLKPIEIIPNPLADFVIESGHIRTLPITKRIGMICNGWDDRKNPKPALLAFAKLRKAQTKTELHIYGNDFGNNEAAQRSCDSHDISSGMIFHGAVTHKQLIEQLNDLDLLLHPSLEESFGVVIAEAMALGLPIVAGKNSGAVPWVIDYDETSNLVSSGVLTNVSNPDELILAMEIAFDQDYSQRSSVGYKSARERFSPKVITQAYLELYKKILLDSSDSFNT